MSRRDLRPFAEAGGIAGSALLFGYFLAVSWRKWPDPIVDYGRELYIPWRLSHGAVLFRDVDDVYGPLSQYFDSALFTLFGPSFMLLVVADILVFIGILTLTYLLFRRAWGAVPALASVALYIAVFGFSQFANCGNYNYATPYSHETVHGLFICLILVHILLRWLQNETGPGAFLIGLLFGCALVLKAEIALTSAILIAATWGLKYRSGTPVRRHTLGLMTLGALFPTLCFLLFFSVSMPWSYAALATANAWFSATTSTRLSGYPLQLYFLGLDRPWENLRAELLAAFWACLLFAGIAAVSRWTDKMALRWPYLLGVAFLAAGVFCLATHVIAWAGVGRCLPGLLLIYLAVCATTFLRTRSRAADCPVQLTRILIALLATTLLVRMFLNARIYHYGYYQAALAAITVPAVLLGELPAWIGVGRKGAAVIFIATVALLLPGVFALCEVSREMLSEKTVPVGTGADLFYASRLDRAGEFVDAVSEALRKGPRDEALMVLPEGVMINYLARLPSPAVPNCYFSIATEDGRENLIMTELTQHPPDTVVIISRPLLEYGIRRWGATTGEGKQILDWVHANYIVEAYKGGDPLDPYQSGVIIYTRKPGFP